MEEIGHLLLPWYDRFHRELPWRGVQDPYAIWGLGNPCFSKPRGGNRTGRTSRGLWHAFLPGRTGASAPGGRAQMLGGTGLLPACAKPAPWRAAGHGRLRRPPACRSSSAAAHHRYRSLYSGGHCQHCFRHSLPRGGRQCYPRGKPSSRYPGGRGGSLRGPGRLPQLPHPGYRPSAPETLIRR